MSDPIKTLFLAAALCALPCALRAQSVQLRDGQVLLAAIEEVDGQGLRVRRLDTGGVLDLRWEHLSVESMQRIKRAHDLLGGAEEELMVTADLVRYQQSGTPTEIVGRIVDRTAQHLVVQVKGTQYKIPRADVGFARTMEVPAMQVYTLDEYYTKRLFEVQPGDSADRHVLLAQELIRVRDYDHAEDHLKQAETLGNSRNPAQIATLQERLKRYRESARERGVLDQIATARNRATAADLEKGQKLIDEFPQQFPQSKLKAEFETEKKRFAEARERFLTGRVADLWRQQIRYVADRKVGEAGLTLSAAREFATSKMGEEIVAKVSAQLSVTPEEARELWRNRAKYPKGKQKELFVYGIGTWVLGEAAIVKDTKADQRPQDAPKDPAQDREIERIARAIAQAMERRRQAGGGGSQEASDEDWWREAPRVEKTGWLRAYYAEFSGDLVVASPAYLQPCVTCVGEGTVPDIVDGKMVRMKCFLCHGTKFLRSFYAY